MSSCGLCKSLRTLENMRSCRKTQSDQKSLTMEVSLRPQNPPFLGSLWALVLGAPGQTANLVLACNLRPFSVPILGQHPPQTSAFHSHMGHQSLLIYRPQRRETTPAVLSGTAVISVVLLNQKPGPSFPGLWGLASPCQGHTHRQQASRSGPPLPPHRVSVRQKPEINEFKQQRSV